MVKDPPTVVDLPARIKLMETMSSSFFKRLKTVSVAELKSLRPSGKFVPLIDDLIEIRKLMGEE